MVFFEGIFVFYFTLTFLSVASTLLSVTSALLSVTLTFLSVTPAILYVAPASSVLRFFFPSLAPLAYKKTHPQKRMRFLLKGSSYNRHRLPKMRCRQRLVLLLIFPCHYTPMQYLPQSQTIDRVKW